MRLARRQFDRKGLSLLEVILSIAILGMSLAIIYQLINAGYRSANNAKLMTDANILADTKMAEVAAGAIELESTAGMVIEENPEWTYSVEVGDSDHLGLLLVTVTVEQVDVAQPIRLSIVRFMPDPDFDPLALENSN